MRSIHFLTAAALVTPGAAQAQTNAITNGVFSSGPSGLLAWVVEGDVAVVGPTRRAALTTASVLYEDDAPLAAGFNNNSGQAAVDFADCSMEAVCYHAYWASTELAAGGGLLIGVDRSRDTLLENTRHFAAGLPANNALLWGARGMGKSS